MATKTPDTDTDDSIPKGEDWLERNATSLDFSVPRDNDSDSWQRAKDSAGEAEFEQAGPTLFEVELPDGDRHDVMLVREDDDPDADSYAGACDCEGFEYHGMCAHLCAMAQTDVVQDVVKTLPSVYDQFVAGDDSSSDDVDDADQEESEDVQEDVDEDREQDADDDGLEEQPDQDGAVDEQDDVDEATPAPEAYDETNDDVPDADVVDEPVEATPVSPDEPQGSDPQNRPAAPSTDAKTPKPVIDGVTKRGPIEAAPEWAKSEIQDRGGELDLNKDGCQFVAAMLGIDTEREFRERAEENDWQYAIVECTARLGDRSVTREATAHIEESNVEKHDMNRMAETRAYKRAVKSISGGGLAAFARDQ